jgi:DNA-binding NarL/FixJ family response regulator
LRILVVDDHPLIQEALQIALQRLDSESQIVGASDFGVAELQIETGAKFDLVLLDLGLPGMSGLRALEIFRDRYPQLPVVVISATDDRSNVLAALDLGAMGYIPKTLSSSIILGALRLVVSGGIYVPATVLVRSELAEDSPARQRLSADAPNPRAADIGLSERQAEILHLLLKGLSNKLICRELDLAEGTVKVHISSILKILGVANRTQAVLVASRLGLRLDGSPRAPSPDH